MTDIVNHCMKTDGLLLHAMTKARRPRGQPHHGSIAEVWTRAWAGTRYS